MLENIDFSSNLGSLARAKNKRMVTKSVPKTKLDGFIAEGWVVEKNNSSSVRIKKEKAPNKIFRDRVWTLLYKMNFQYLSGDLGSKLISSKEPEEALGTIDIVGIDNEVALAIDCKFADKRLNRIELQEEISTFSNLRENFARTINKDYGTTHKRQMVMVMFLENISLTMADKDEANRANIILFEEQDLTYYESLISHIGPAAKYQFFADMIPGKKVPGLEIRVPAVKTKMGGSNCYTFSISPEYLLKISYISHRAKGRTSDVNTYQRMISRSRLATIKKYISDDGIFPTNVVLNLEQKQVQFERISQDTKDKQSIESGILGWLTIRPTYKSAWIIDGQHRLYAYSGHEKALNSKLSILAFEGLLPSKQAELFIDINAKQKSVKQSLLQELYAELHWNADDPEVRIQAILSKTIQDLGTDPDSALYGRIQTADSGRDTTRCISLTSIFTACKTGFHIQKIKNGVPVEFGPLWAGSNEEILTRTTYIIKSWLNIIRLQTRDWWDKGSAEGGGLAMNDGIITCINLLKSVLSHLESKGTRLIDLNNSALLERIEPFALMLGDYLGAFSEEEKKKFRDLRGIQGQTTRTRRCQQALHERENSFNPSGLEEFINLEKAQTNIRAKEIIDWIETTMQKYILEELRQEFGNAESEWWTLGIPKNVRLKVIERYEQNDGQRGGREYYFELMDYRKIILDNWSLFEKTFSYQKTGNKESKTSWLNTVNNNRNVVSHPSSGVTLSIEELEQLEDYKKWLQGQLLQMDFDTIDEEETDPVLN